MINGKEVKNMAEKIYNKHVVVTGDTRKFQGEKYHEMGQWWSKKRVKEVAKDMRDDGYNARITKAKPAPPAKTGYKLWVRKGKKKKK